MNKYYTKHRSELWIDAIQREIEGTIEYISALKLLGAIFGVKEAQDRLAVLYLLLESHSNLN